MNGQLTRLACLFLLLLAGCETTQSSGKLDTPPITPTPYSRVGTILQKDLAAGTVVTRLDYRNTQLNNELFVRNSRLEIVSVLKPTGLRTGNSVGMVILSGDPQVGMEVVQKMQK